MHIRRLAEWNRQIWVGAADELTSWNTTGKPDSVTEARGIRGVVFVAEAIPKTGCARVAGLRRANGVAPSDIETLETGRREKSSTRPKCELLRECAFRFRDKLCVGLRWRLRCESTTCGLSGLGGGVRLWLGCLFFLRFQSVALLTKACTLGFTFAPCGIIGLEHFIVPIHLFHEILNADSRIVIDLVLILDVRPAV